MPGERSKAEFGEHLAEAFDEKLEVAVDFLKADGDVVRCVSSLHRYFFPAVFLAAAAGGGKSNLLREARARRELASNFLQDPPPPAVHSPHSQHETHSHHIPHRPRAAHSLRAGAGKTGDTRGSRLQTARREARPQGRRLARLSPHSITHQCLYTQYVEDYFYTRYPKLKLHFTTPESAATARRMRSRVRGRCGRL